VVRLDIVNWMLDVGAVMSFGGMICGVAERVIGKAVSNVKNTSINGVSVCNMLGTYFMNHEGIGHS